ncbi:Flp pilus assembly complex ATPase component TadA [Methanospirillum purgamenti]|uniref:Flp pilus assembly complex ATPase component TadA n=1 Tax=Methanospirillum hungatei TaxID=2203 RepID=A0A8F5VPW1_METHU|nr:ATPase, T2SS/T4P/T4SS family [Methanospirillum hungatei]QXO95738.1 Flp pilus assembly complex ATPase component TadA [Methanospirillum hungatei]
MSENTESIETRCHVTIDVQHSIYPLPDIPVQARISHTPYGHRYDLMEPLLNEYERDVYTSLISSLKIHLQDKETYRSFQKKYHEKIQSLINAIAPELSESSLAVLTYFITRDMKGFGPLQPFLQDPDLFHITIPGYNLPVIVRHRHHGMMTTGLIPNENECQKIIKKIENRTKVKITPEKIPLILNYKNNNIKISASSTHDNGPFTIEFQKQKHTVENQIIHQQELKTQEKCIIKSEYLNGYACGRLIPERNGNYHFIIGYPSLSDNEQAIVHEMRIWVHEEKPELRRFQDAKNKILTHLQREYPNISVKSREKIGIRLLLSRDCTRWIRLLCADPLVKAIYCMGPGIPVQILHTQVPGNIKTNIKPTSKDLENISVFFCKVGGRKLHKKSGTISLHFTGGIDISIVREKEGQYPEIRIQKSGALSSSSPQFSSSGNPSEPFLGEEKTEEILSKVFDLTEQKQKPVPRLEKSEIENENISTRKSWKDKFGRTLYWKIPSAGFKRRKKRPDLNVQTQIPEIPEVQSVLDVQVQEGLIVEEAYWLISPHAYAVVLKDPAGDRMYRVIEPDLTPRERIVLEETHETLRDVLIYDKPVNKGDLLLDYDEAAKVIRAYDPKITDGRLSVLYYYLKRNLNGYGKIDPLMHDEMLEDISCNGHHLPVYVHHRFYASMPTSVIFDQEELNRFVLKLSQKADKQVSLTSPLLDAALPNGSRAQITYSDVVSTKGSSFTIRKFRSDPMTPITLLGFGTYDPELLAFLWLALENRKSLIVVGGTASGKTSAMNALSFFIPHNSKIVSLEDTRELQIPHQNWLPVQTRESATLNERGNIDLFDLLKASLRQRPEYIIVGEVRGSEAQTLFQAMNSGHTTISTLHAGTIEEALNRLTNEPINVPPAMFGALNLMVIQTFHYRKGQMIRRCDAVHEIILKEGDKLGWNTLYEYNPSTDGFDRKYAESKTLENIRYMHNWTRYELEYQLKIRKEFLNRINNQSKYDPTHLMQLITRLRRMA